MASQLQISIRPKTSVLSEPTVMSHSLHLLQSVCAYKAVRRAAASMLWAQHLDLRCVLLSDPGIFGAGGPNQNTSRIQHTGKEVQASFSVWWFLGAASPYGQHMYTSQTHTQRTPLRMLQTCVRPCEHPCLPGRIAWCVVCTREGDAVCVCVCVRARAWSGLARSERSTLVAIE